MNPILTALASTNHAVAAPLGRWLSGSAPDVQIRDAGRAMLSVSTDGLDEFRYDKRAKGYDDPNGVFADILGPLDSDLPEPLLFYLAAGNQPGVLVDRVGDPSVWVISLGEPYGFGELVGSIAHILDQQCIEREARWFADVLAEHGLDPSDPMYRSIVGPT